MSEVVIDRNTLETLIDESSEYLKLTNGEELQEAIQDAKESLQEPYPDWEYGQACPECENEYLHEVCEAMGVVSVDSGDVRNFELSQLGDELMVECPECETVLMDRACKP